MIAREDERWAWTDEGCTPGVLVLVRVAPEGAERLVVASVKPMRDDRWKPWMRLPRGPGGAPRWVRGEWQLDVSTAASYAERVLMREGIVRLEYIDRTRLEGVHSGG